MDSEIRELIQCLNIEMDIYKRFAELSLLKKEIIIKGGVAELEAIIEDEKSLIDEINAAELERDKLVNSVSRLMNLNGDNIVIADIIEKADNPEHKKQLKDLLDEFSGIISNQKKLNKTNQILLQKNINYIDFVMNNVILGNENLTYSSGGSDNTSNQKTNIFDQRV